MKTVTPVHIKTKDFGPVIYRTKDNVIFFYQYYSPMESMGDERHDLHFVSSEEVSIGDLYFDKHNNLISEAGVNTDHKTYLYPKVVATTSEKIHRLNKIPLISEDFVRQFCYKNGKIESIELETTRECRTGSHCKYGSNMNHVHKCKHGCQHTIDILKINDQGEVVVYVEPEFFVDWNTFSIEQLISHLENEFRFSSSGTAKAVHELIKAYKEGQVKKELSEDELLKIFDKNASEHMIMWNLESFKKSHRTLLKAIVASMKQL